MNRKRKTYLLNTIAGLLTAFQSTIILTVMARFSTLENSGIFTIAYAMANLFVTIGVYGTNTFQISDVNNDVPFESYLSFRKITCLVMMIITVCYSGFQIVFSDYKIEKALVIIIISLWTMVDAIGDVFYARLQILDRLDYASISIILRRIGSLASFCLVIIIYGELLLASLMALLISIIILIGTIIYRRIFFITYHRENVKLKQLSYLCCTCFPLFIYSFLSLYITNIPKYAIDNFMGDEAQAIYGYIAMPVFVIELLNSFIVQPMLVPMSLEWQKNQKQKTQYRVKKQLVIITGMTLSIVFASYFVGIPVLTILYHYNLHNYRMDFLLLLLGGGFLAIARFITTILTIMRKQKIFMYIYIVGGIVFQIAANILVKEYGTRGASIGYLLMMSSISIALLIVCFRSLK